MSSDEIVIDVRNLTKHYEIYATPRDRLKQLIFPPLQKVANRIGSVFGISTRRDTPRFYREFHALNEISFQVRRGETLGIIGRNGSGKSTLLQILAGTLTPTSGEVIVNGRVAALLELGSGFNPEFTGRENVFLNGQILGLSQKEIESRYDQIAEFADIGEFIDQPVKTYSSGMFVRLAFAVQAHIDASIVIIDEALAVGDVFFRQKCYARLEQLRNSGAAILLVSHAMPDIEQYCERAILLDRGEARFIGSSSEAAKHYYLLHQAENNKVISPKPIVARPPPLDGSVNQDIDRPSSEAFLDLSGKPQVSNGQATCVGIALRNANGDPCSIFRQGDTAFFYYEFELYEDIGVPICGIVISNERGVIVHGKNSWQSDNEFLLSINPGSRLICQQEIQLNLGPGEYIFEVGLACISIKDWKNREHISHDEFSVLHKRICHLPSIGQFSIGLAMKEGRATLTHHGVADLPGKISKTLA